MGVNRPNLTNIKGSNYFKESMREKNMNKNLSKKTDLIYEINNKKKPIMRNFKFNGKKMMQSSVSFAKNQNNDNNNEPINKNCEQINRRVVGQRPLSASMCFASAGRHYNFVENLLEQSKNVTLSKQKAKL